MGKYIFNLGKSLFFEDNLHLAYNIFITFFLIVSGISMNFQREFLVAAPQIVLNVWDFWLNVHVCDITEKAGEKTLTILRRFTDLQHKDVELERSVSKSIFI